MSPASDRKFSRHFPDDPVTRVGDGINRMPEPDNDFLVCYAAADIGLGFVRAFVALLDIKCGLIGPPVLGPRRAPIAPVMAE